MTKYVSDRYSVGDFDDRPWGHWKVTDIGEGFVIKTITVDPGKRLSLQYHHHRIEYWTVVSGEGVAEVGEEKHNLVSGSFLVIPKKMKHRLRCSGIKPLILVEIQTGLVLKESDIFRLEDDYNRV